MTGGFGARCDKSEKGQGDAFSFPWRFPMTFDHTAIAGGGLVQYLTGYAVYPQQIGHTVNHYDVLGADDPGHVTGSHRGYHDFGDP